MKFSTAIVATIFSATAFAAPAPVDAVSMAAAQQWTIENMKRTCTTTVCNWSFKINNNAGSDVACAFKVNGNPASQTDSSGHVCGPYTIGTGWSGQFGAGKGFTTLSVVNNAKGLIAYPAYTDAELASGKPVKPNRSYPVQKLP